MRKPFTAWDRLATGLSNHNNDNDNDNDNDNGSHVSGGADGRLLHWGGGHHEWFPVGVEYDRVDDLVLDRSGACGRLAG